MAEVRFSDGASYDHMMGPWRRSVGEAPVPVIALVATAAWNRT